ncbi:MAG: FAD-binding oxidoreductase, partial [Selenomonadaceae bacterium]|nr:FAD-binding oxidoreductase [Selenomonadaceae bacterium]
MSCYKPMDEQDLAVIATFLDRERILWKDEINEEYSHDELTVKSSYPDLVARVISAQEVSKILAYANEKRIAVTPRGAGTGLVGASVAIEKGIMIDTTLMNH